MVEFLYSWLIYVRRFLPDDKSVDDDNYTDVWKSLYRCVCVCVCVCMNIVYTQH